MKSIIELIEEAEKSPYTKYDGHSWLLDFSSEDWDALHNNARALIDVAKAAERRLEYSHNDTCAFSLSEKYPCSCGHSQLNAALNKLRGQP